MRSADKEADKKVRKSIERANALTVTALASDFVKKRYAELGASVWPTTPDEAKAYRESE